MKWRRRPKVKESAFSFLSGEIRPCLDENSGRGGANPFLPPSVAAFYRLSNRNRATTVCARIRWANPLGRSRTRGRTSRGPSELFVWRDARTDIAKLGSEICTIFLRRRAVCLPAFVYPASVRHSIQQPDSERARGRERVRSCALPVPPPRRCRQRQIPLSHNERLLQ